MASRSQPTHYQILGVMADATSDQIRAAYRDRAKLAHPDAGGDPDQFRAVLEAYETLVDPRRRRAYDDAHDIRPPSSSTDGSASSPTQGWSGTRGDFSGSVEFPSYLRDITDQPWDTSRRADETRTDHEQHDPVSAASAANVVWWWPDQARSAPILAGALIIVSGATALVALAAHTGHEAWRTELGSPPCGTAVVTDDVAIVWSENGTLHGIDLGTGVSRWRSSIGVPGSGGITAVGHVVVAARDDGRVIAINPNTGATTWDTKLTSPASVPLAVVANDQVAVALTRGSVEAVEARKGRHRWRIPFRSPVEIAPCALGNTVWLAGVGGSLIRLDSATGAVQGTVNLGGVVAGLCADPRFGGSVFACVGGPSRLVALDEFGRLHLSVDLPRVCAEPAITENHVYVLDPTGMILVIDRLRRAITAAATLPFEPIGSPLIVGTQLVMLARDGRMWATVTPPHPS